MVLLPGNSLHRPVTALAKLKTRRVHVVSRLAKQQRYMGCVQRQEYKISFNNDILRV